MKILTIEGCEDCMWHQEFTDNKAYCMAMDDREIQGRRDIKIPIWCPLPDRKTYLAQENIKETLREVRKERRIRKKLAAEQKVLESEREQTSKETSVQ
jgi:hypothetical protein